MSGPYIHKYEYIKRLIFLIKKTKFVKQMQLMHNIYIYIFVFISVCTQV